MFAVTSNMDTPGASRYGWRAINSNWIAQPSDVSSCDYAGENCYSIPVNMSAIQTLLSASGDRFVNIFWLARRDDQVCGDTWESCEALPLVGIRPGETTFETNDVSDFFVRYAYPASDIAAWDEKGSLIYSSVALGSQNIPEPASLALLGLGLAGLGFSRRKKA